jgi:hypothetical protein
MGMFNTVRVNIPCPKCGDNINEFQTKDETYEPLYLSEVDFWTVREFHSSCDRCDTWVSVRLKKEVIAKLTLDDYEVVGVRIGE